MLPVSGRFNMSLNMPWQPYEPLGCWVGEEQRSRRERRWEAWPCRWFSQWSNHNYSSESAVQTGGYHQSRAQFCCLFLFPPYLYPSSVCQFHAFVCFFLVFLEIRMALVCVCVWEGCSSDTETVLTDIFMNRGGVQVPAISNEFVFFLIICKFDNIP